MPVAFAFMTFNVVGVFLLWGGKAGLQQLTLSMFTSISFEPLIVLPMFILMGEVLFHSGVFFKVLDIVDQWMGRLPGRLCLGGVAGGTIFAAMAGSGMSATAMFGALLVPEMERRGYKRTLSMGSIMASGSLAPIIPPSGLAVILAILADISIGKLLISGVFPGLLIASIYTVYIILRCKLQPSVAPAYEPIKLPFFQRMLDTLHYGLPFGSIIFVVIGLIFMGVTSPTESAAAGALSTFILTAFYRRLSWDVVWKSVSGTLRITVMMFIILTGSTAFSQILSFSGAGRSLVEAVVAIHVPPTLLLIIMQAFLVLFGSFMEEVSMMMITLPVFMPLVQIAGIDKILFGLLSLINMEIGMISPPFGFMLFTMKGVAPPDTTMGEVFRAAMPFLLLELIAMAIIVLFPAIATWLPGKMVY
jgi:tripartite ATP-independent transporter DctM subunit